MSTKNLDYPAIDSPAVFDIEYFIPLSLKLDEFEKENFFRVHGKRLISQIGDQKSLYQPMTDCKEYFSKTLAQTEKFLEPLGLAVRNFTVFVAPPTANINDSKNIHIDSTKLPSGEDVILEARLSYYETAETPGVVRWYPKTEEYYNIKEHIPGKLDSNIWVLPWIQDLKEKKITWEQAPDWVFATSTNTPSALIRTNLPHHVIQGSGNRLTISAQLVFAKSRSPVGVWEHIQKNLHLLKI